MGTHAFILIIIHANHTTNLMKRDSGILKGLKDRMQYHQGLRVGAQQQLAWVNDDDGG